MTAPTKTMCAGCRDNFYNGNNGYGIQECWSFKSATIVRKMVIPINMRPPYTFPPRDVMSCYKPDGNICVVPEGLTKDGYWR